jgi:hypothetical protein
VINELLIAMANVIRSDYAPPRKYKKSALDENQLNILGLAVKKTPNGTEPVPVKSLGHSGLTPELAHLILESGSNV